MIITSIAKAIFCCIILLSISFVIIRIIKKEVALNGKNAIAALAASAIIVPLLSLYFWSYSTTSILNKVSSTVYSYTVNISNTYCTSFNKEQYSIAELQEEIIKNISTGIPLPNFIKNKNNSDILTNTQTLQNTNQIEQFIKNSIDHYLNFAYKKLSALRWITGVIVLIITALYLLFMLKQNSTYSMARKGRSASCNNSRTRRRYY